MSSPKGSPRRAAAAVAEPAPMPTYVSPSMEVLEDLEIHNALSGLEGRLDSLEIDIARVSGSREDDARRLAGEMAVMKARVEDALIAFAGTAEELREVYRAVERTLKDGAGAAEMREELHAGIDGAMAGVGDAMQSLSTEVGERIGAIAGSMNEMGEAIARLTEAVARLEARS